MGAGDARTSGRGQSAKADEVADQAKAAASQVVEEVQRQVGARFAEQVERSAGRVGGLSEALTAVGRELRARDDHALAGLTDRAADEVGRFAQYLRGKDLDEIVYEGEQLARRQPALFLGGAFLIGIAAARFLKSSGRPRGGGYGAPGRYGRPPARYMSRDRAYDPSDYELGRGGYGRPGAVGPTAAGGATSMPGRAGASGGGSVRSSPPTTAHQAAGTTPPPASVPSAPTTSPGSTAGGAAGSTPTPAPGGVGGPGARTTGL
jgi:hypothetical protein